MANIEGEEEGDDYLSMNFEDTSSSKKETSLQRTTRLKKEAAERGRVLSKAELAAKEKAAREAALATELDNSNKGAKIMAKMGFKAGDTLGQTENARKNPIELLMKGDRGGIGMDSEKKRKVREAAEAMEAGEKRQKLTAEEFRERNRIEREEKRAEGQMWGAMKVLEGLEEEKTETAETGEDGVEGSKMTSTIKKPQKLSDINILYRPLVKQRLERDHERQMRIELNNSLSTRNEESDGDTEVDTYAQLNDDEDDELREFEALPSSERLEKVVSELREKYFYCFWSTAKKPKRTEVSKAPKPTGVSKARSKKSKDVTNSKRRASQLLEESIVLEEIQNGASKKPSRSTKSNKSSKGRVKPTSLEESCVEPLMEDLKNGRTISTLAALLYGMEKIFKYVDANLQMTAEMNEAMDEMDSRLLKQSLELTSIKSHASLTMGRLLDVQRDVLDIADRVDQPGATGKKAPVKLKPKYEQLRKVIVEAMEARMDRVA